MQKHAALLVIDLQRDFCPGGDEIVPLVNGLAARFETAVLTPKRMTSSEVFAHA